MNKTIKYSILTGFIIVAILIFIITNNSQSMNLDSLDIDQIIYHIEELSSAKYEGRKAGTLGNQLGMEYIVNQFENSGINPAGEDESYYQPFKTIVPKIDTKPIFTINNSEGIPQKELVMYEDYNALTNIDGGGIDFNGKLLLTGSNLLIIDKELIKDSIIVIESGILVPKWIDYVKDNGGRGILCCTDTGEYASYKRNETSKTLSTSGKTNTSMFIGFLSRNAYSYMKEIIGDKIEEKPGKALGTIENVTIKVDMTFPIVETANIIGQIQGKSNNGQILLLSANIDNLGMGSNGTHFPGTLSETSGIASLIEIARMLAKQNNQPYDTIVFLGLNGQMADLAGSKYYINNPLFPLEKTTHIHLGSLGESSYDPAYIYFDILHSSIISDQLVNYGKDLELYIDSLPIYNGIVTQFSMQLVPSIVIESSTVSNNYEDTMENYSQDKLNTSLILVLNYIKHEVYRDNSIDFLAKHEVIVLFILMVAAIANLIISTFYKNNPTSKILSASMEEIYYTTPVILLRSFFKSVFPYIITVIMLSLLANINPNTNVVILGDRLKSNFSGYLTLKESTLYLKSMLDLEFHRAQNVGNIFEVIISAGSKSLKLIGAALSLSVLGGISRGLYEGYSTKHKQFRSLGSIIIFSIPDVLIVLIGLMLLIFIANHFPELKESIPLSEFIMPVIVLSIIPTIYISRMTYVTIHDELNKDYIKNAKAVGYSKFAIYTKEMLPAVIFKIIDSIPTIITMLFSNMIIIEYLFNYNGIVYYLLYLYNRNDIYRFVPLALSLGAIYLVFTWTAQSISKWINPLKQEVNK